MSDEDQRSPVQLLHLGDQPDDVRVQGRIERRLAAILAVSLQARCRDPPSVQPKERPGLGGRMNDDRFNNYGNQIPELPALIPVKRFSSFRAAFDRRVDAQGRVAASGVPKLI